METLFTNHRQALKVRLLLWFSLLVCAGTLYGGWALFGTYGLNPGDGGVLLPFGERLAIGLFVAALGVAFAGGMILFATLYAVYAAREGDQLIIDTLTPWGVGTRRHEFNVCEIGTSAYYHGRMEPGKSSIATGVGIFPSVDAPWITLRAAGRRFPFILDLQAEIIEIGPLTVLAEGAVEGWREDRG